jgi:hypothetical protein
VENLRRVTATSPRLDRRLRAAAVEVDDPSLPVAETWRKVGLEAEELGLPRPGYDTIRRIVRDHRRRRAEVGRLLEPVVGDLLQGRLSVWDIRRLVEAAAVAGGRDPGEQPERELTL